MVARLLMDLTDITSMVKYFIFCLPHDLPVVFSATSTRHFLLLSQPVYVHMYILCTYIYSYALIHYIPYIALHIHFLSVIHLLVRLLIHE